MLFQSGWNFVENNDRPFDPLSGGMLANPAHGTKSGSVIVSPPGKQWLDGGSNEFVTGVAPGARLVPLRVHKSVVHFNPSRLAQAINYAAAPDGVHIRLPQGAEISAISISMGGLPSVGLYRAVQNARDLGAPAALRSAIDSPRSPPASSKPRAIPKCSRSATACSSMRRGSRT